MSRHAVIFSSYIPQTKTGIKIGEYYLDIFNRRFYEDDIYIGINIGTCRTWYEMIKSSGLRASVFDVPLHLYVNSDVAGFQAAINGLFQTKETYDYYWLGHTKGASHDCFEATSLLREHLELNYWSRRKEIESRCLGNQYGVFGSFFTPTHTYDRLTERILQDILSEKKSIIGYVNRFTFYGFTRSVMEKLSLYKDGPLFKKNIVNQLGLNRYFFEGGFAWVSDLFGLMPYFLDIQRDISNDHNINLCYYNSWSENQKKVEIAALRWRSEQSYALTTIPHFQDENVYFDGTTLSPQEFVKAFPGFPLCEEDKKRLSL